MKKIIFLFIISIILFSCKDNTQYEQTTDVRVEYSSCIACADCVVEFDCPENAIIIDPVSGKAYIDADKCDQCMKCIDKFNCPTDAFVTTVDNIAPAKIEDFLAISDTTGQLNIIFTSVGDDENIGTAHHYSLLLLDENQQEINYNLELPLPQTAGNIENWIINDLPINETITVILEVFDEIGQFPESAVSQIEILGIIEDTTPPNPILDLNANNPSTTTAILSFTAVGDDEDEGIASSYTIKYFLENIDETNWNNATEFPNTFIPQNAGEIESLQIIGLDVNTEYYFAIKAIDDNENISTLSNIANITTESIADIVPPATISDLQITAGSDYAELIWTAVGDDENSGTAYSYDLRYSTSEITEINWDDAEVLPNVPTPSPAETVEDYTAENLIPGTTYFFAIKAIDESDNISAMSDCVEITTLNDLSAPGIISDFTVYEGYYTAHNRIKVEWTATGNDGDIGTADHYEIRYATSEITEENWSSASLADNPPSPSESGTSESLFIVNLEEATIYYFAIKAFDAAGNISEISASPAGKIVFQILEDQCHDCNACINDCDYGAISDVGPYKTIDPDICQTCGDCTCPFNLIKLWVVAY